MSIELQPIAGQPGLFRQRRGLSGVDAVLTSRIARAQDAYISLKSDVQALLDRFPTPLQPTTYENLARRVVELPGDTLIRLTTEQLATVLKAALSSAGRNIGFAYAMSTAPDVIAASNRTQIEKLTVTAERVTSAAQVFIDSINRSRDAAERGLRTVGLAAAPIPIGVLIAGVILGTIAIIVEGAIVYTLFAYISAAVESYVAAERACERDAALGRPCTGAAWEAYRQAAEEQTRRLGVVPNVQNLFDSVGSTVFWGSMLVIGGLLAYGYYVTAPAAERARAGLVDEVESVRSRRRR